MGAFRPVQWLRAHPVVADGLLAALMWAIGLAFYFSDEIADGLSYVPRDADPLGFVLVTCSVLPLTFRRVRPTAVLFVVGLAVIWFEARNYNAGLGGIPVVFALYSVAAHAPRGVALWSLGFTVIGTAVALVASAADIGLAEFIANYVIFGLAWVLGDNLRNRRAYLAEVEARAERADRDQDARARDAVAAERARIARELHDVVAHAMSVMVVQAGGARRIVDQAPAQAVEALGNIETTGRQALDEMRRLLGVIRDDSDAGHSRSPLPTIGDIDQLVHATEDAGLAIEYVCTGDPTTVSESLGLTTYRLVQEALTNTMKHGGPNVHTSVRVTIGDEAVEVEVVDDGRGSSAPPSDHGHGIVGMRERVGAFDGTLRAGPKPGGGFRVVASLPLDRQTARS